MVRSRTARAAIALFFLASLVYAKEHLIEDFTGGLNTRTTASKMDPKFSPRISGLVADREVGAVQKPNGFEVIAATSTLTKVNSIGILNTESGDRYIIISDGERVLSTKDFVSFTTLRTGQNGSYRFNFEQVENKLWGSNGFDSVFTWDGSSVVLLNGTTHGGVATPNVPRGKYILYEQGLVWVYNTTTSASALNYNSDSSTTSPPIALNPDNKDAWPITNELNIGKGDGEVGTALFS